MPARPPGWCRSLLAVLFWACLSLEDRDGRAQLAVDRLVPAPGPGGFIQVEEAAVPGARQLYVTSSLSVLSQPLVLRDATSAVVGVPVRDRVALDLGAELGLLDQRISVGIGWPIALYQDGDRQGPGGPGYPLPPSGPSVALPTTDIGDLRFRGKAQLTRKTAPVQVAVGLDLTVPGGGPDSYLASASPTCLTRLMVNGRWHWFSGGINAAVRFQRSEQVYLYTLGHHGEWGAALALHLPHHRVDVSAIAEAVGLVLVQGPSPSYPVELRGALRLGFGPMAIDIGAGGGPQETPLDPAWRAFVVWRVRAVPPGG